MSNDNRSLNGRKAPSADVADETPWVQVNRNFTDLARPAARKARFKRSSNGHLSCAVNANVTLHVDPNADLKHRRYATGFDVFVLHFLVTMTSMRPNNRLRLTRVQFLERMKIESTSRNRKDLASALEFWQHVSVHFDRFRVPNKGRDRTYVNKTFEPPIRVRRDGTIIVNKDWKELNAAGYFEAYQLPLPTNAYVQNALFTIHERHKKRESSKDVNVKVFESKRELTRDIGIDQHTRNKELKNVLKKLAAWFEECGGTFVRYKPRPDGSFAIKYTMPEMCTKTKKTKSKSTSKKTKTKSKNMGKRRIEREPAESPWIKVDAKDEDGLPFPYWKHARTGKIIDHEPVD